MQNKKNEKVIKPLAPEAAAKPPFIAKPAEKYPGIAPEQSRRVTTGGAEAMKSPIIPALSKPAPARSPAVHVAFCLHAPQARIVSLCGEFNAWSAEATPMRKQDDGRWKTTLVLPPGRYQYKFIADGEWVHDPTARQNVPNPHGSLNSVIEVQA